ncbi:MAG: hypothetical protein GXP32_04325 [Kiritimatiellaeota bacterium]|nr:hypothetical protein [Kiritimatiellota bacterium]
MLTINRANWSLWSIFLLYAGFTFALVIYHEPWMDEGQAWLIARDLSISGVFSQMQYEGTPALWHFLIMPLAKSGLPYFSMRLLHYIIALVIVWIALFKSPYPIYLKVVLVFSFMLGFEYVVVARNYSISLLLIFILAHLHDGRLKSPWIYAVSLGLLFNTNVHSFGLAAAMTAGFIYALCRESGKSNSRKILFCAIPLVAAFLAMLQLISSPDNIHFGMFQNFDLEALFVALVDGFTAVDFQGCVADGVLSLLLLSLFWFVYVLWRERAFHPLMVMISSYAWLFYIFVFKHSGSFRHHVFLLITVLYCLWILLSSSPKMKHRDGLCWAFSLPLLCSIWVTLNFAILEFQGPFSRSSDVAEYIKDSGSTYQSFVCHQSYYACGILPYRPERKFWYPDIRSYGTFITWNKDFRENQNILLGDILRRVRQARLKKTLFILRNKIKRTDLRKYGLEPLARFEGAFGYGDENYYLYRLKRDYE